MGPHPRRFAIVAAVLWLGSGLGGRAEAGIILQTPAGLNPGDHFRFVFVTDGIRDATSTNIADYDSFVNARGGRSHVQWRGGQLARHRFDGFGRRDRSRRSGDRSRVLVRRDAGNHRHDPHGTLVRGTRPRDQSRPRGQPRPALPSFGPVRIPPAPGSAGRSGPPQPRKSAPPPTPTAPGYPRVAANIGDFRNVLRDLVGSHRRTNRP